MLAIGAAVWLIVRIGEEDPTRLGTAALIFGGGAFLVLGGLLAVAWAVLELRLSRPLMRLIGRLETVGHSGSESGLDTSPDPSLAPLYHAVELLLGELFSARQEVAEAMDRARARSEEQKGRLEAILRDLSEGVLVCNMNHEVLLYNQAALRVLETPEELGLGRSLFQLLNKASILHSLERLQSWFANGSPGEPGRHIATFVGMTADAKHLLHGRMTLVMDQHGSPTSYVLVLTDVSRELNDLTQRDALLYRATEGMRAPLANLRAAAETVDANPDLDETQRKAFEKVILSESIQLAERLEGLTQDYRGLVAGPWSMDDLYGPDLLNFVRGHLQASGGLEVTLVGRPAWLRGDSHTLMLVLEFLVRQVSERTGAKAFDLEAWHGPSHCYIDLRWTGEAIPSRELDAWLAGHLPGAVGATTLRDALERHGSEPWSRQEDTDNAMLRIPLPAAPQPEPSLAREPLPPRPEFYDFDLIHRQEPSGALGQQRLADLSFVVFDTETTGLRPSAGDEIVSIAGVRIVNRRILTGECFERLVNPRRPIPEASTKFHGITEDMVEKAPPIQVVLPQFEAFVADAVLVGHNAAFDMKFLQLKEAESGASFQNPVLDTLLLSVWLHAEDQDHSLDGIAARFGVEVVGRHTALGDAQVTAAVFLRMLRLLEARGITTLQQAYDASEQMVEIRRQQAAF
jgi:DNA polymerase-3 subunit epsilon